MKKLFPLIYLLAISISLFSQRTIDINGTEISIEDFRKQLKNGNILGLQTGTLEITEEQGGADQQSYSSRSGSEQLLRILRNRYDTVSGTWQQSSKDEIETTALKKIEAVNGFYWNNQIWNPSYNYQYDYDQEGRIVKTVFLGFNSSTNLIEPIRKEERAYDVHGNIAAVSHYDWNTSTTLWEKNIKNLTTYTASGVLVESITQTGDPGSGQWVNASRYEAFFNTNEEINYTIRQSWENGIWVNDKITTYTYNADNQLIQNITSDAISGVDIQRRFYQYDIDGNMIEYLNQKMNSTNQWEDSFKYNASFDNYGNETEYIIYSWTNGILNFGVKVEPQFDQFGNQIEKVDYDFDILTNDWIEYYKWETVVDTNTPITEISPTNYYPYLINNKMLKIYGSNWDKDANDWIPISEDIYEYQTTTSNENLNVDQLALYPNPAADYFVIDANLTQETTLHIFSTLGQQVAETTISNGQQIDVSMLNNGTYLCRLQADGQQHSGKFVVQR